MELQRTLDGELVPTAAHRDDIVETEDGATMRFGDVEFTDCRGKLYSTEEARDEADIDIVTEILDSQDEWISDYVASDDYGNDYCFVAWEDIRECKKNVGEWLYNTYSDDDYYSDRSCFEEHVEKALIDNIIDALDEFDLEPFYHPVEYAPYTGKGCCVGSIEIGEYEEQFEVNYYDEFKALAADGRLRDCLNKYDGNLCVNVGDRDLTGKYPCFYGYSYGHGRWHYVYSDESMEAALCEAMIAYCRHTDK